MVIGVLAIQGDVIEHINTLKKLDVDAVEVRLPSDLECVKGLILPGGESTTIMKLMSRYGLDKKIKELYNQNKLCIYGTCAGAILLAKKVVGNQPTLELLDIQVARNAYGRQIDSFEIEHEILGKEMNCIFIRAPIIEKIGKDVEVLSELNNNPIMIKEKNILVTTFHPELTNNLTVHKYFVEMCN